MKTKKLLIPFLSLVMTFAFTACTSQEDIDSAVNPLSENITTIDTTLTEMQSQDTALEEKITALEGKVKTLETELSAVDTALTALDGEVDTVIETFTQTKTALENEIAAIKTEITALKAQDTELQTGITALQGRVDGLETSVGTLNTAVIALQAQVAKNTEKIAEMEGQLACLNKGGHSLAEDWTANDGTHSKGCADCSYTLTEACEYSWVSSGEDGVYTATCSVCSGEYQATVTLGAYEKIYSGSAKEPSVTLVVDGKTLAEGTDYDVAYSNNVYVGTAVITITLKGTYVGTIIENFEIIQDPATGGFDGEGVTF